VLQTSTRIKVVDVADNKITAEARQCRSTATVSCDADPPLALFFILQGVSLLVEALLTNRRSCVATLDLSKNCIEAEACLAIGRLLEPGNSSHVEVLDMSWNPLGDLDHDDRLCALAAEAGEPVPPFGCMDALGKAIFGNRTLKTLKLSRTKLSDRGVLSLAKGLGKNATLSELDLSLNDIEAGGVNHLTRVLSSEGGNTSLRRLNLGYNNIGPSGAAKMAQLCLANPDLEAVYGREKAPWDEDTLADRTHAPRYRYEAHPTGGNSYGKVIKKMEYELTMLETGDAFTRHGVHQPADPLGYGSDSVLAMRRAPRTTKVESSQKYQAPGQRYHTRNRTVHSVSEAHRSKIITELYGTQRSMSNWYNPHGTGPYVSRFH